MRGAAGAIEQMLIAAVGVQMRRDNAGLFRRCQYDRASAVAKQNHSAAIAVIDDPATGTSEPTTSAHLALAGAHELVGDG